MEEVDAVDLSKENIQPLKQGRNASILGLALQAQTDGHIHQRLQKMQEAYEIKIRTYSGPDPLELWVEYICWVEQVFPKHGLEGNLEGLLQKCFAALKDEERYNQDPRFVKLWIKFIEMQTNDRLELYRFLSGRGIGTACAEFYRSWAYEFEQLEDIKHADAVFQLGYTNVAQPAADLEAAHIQFQLRVARGVLNNQLHTQESTTNPDSENQRSAMASLCTIGPKQNKAPVVRVGHNVLSATPGTLPNQSSSHHAKSSLLGPSNNIRDGIPIYQDTPDPVGILGKGRSHAPSTTVHSSRNKENSQEAGTWNKPGAVRSRIPPQVAVYQPQLRGSSFEVHRDEAAAIASVTSCSKTFTPSVLKPRKLEENPVKDTIAVYEQPDPSVKTMYPKDKIYGGGKELQLEEIMAIEYWMEKAKDSGDIVDPVEQERLRLEKEMKEIQEKLRLLSKKSLASVHPVPDSEVAPQTAVASNSDIVSGLFDLADPVDNSTVPANQSESKESHSMGQESNTSSARVDNRSSNSLNVLLTPGDAATDAATHSANCSTSELSMDKRKSAFGSGNRGQTSIYNQSVTVHTKLAMNEVDDLWCSPNPVKFLESPAAIPARQAPPDGSVLSFDICRDDDRLTERTSSQPVKSADPFREAEESLAHALGPDVSVHETVFKEPIAAPVRRSPEDFLVTSRIPLAATSQEVMIPEDIPRIQVKPPGNDFAIFSDGLDDHFLVPRNQNPQHIPLAAPSQEAIIPEDIPRIQVASPVNDFPIFNDKPEAQFPVVKEPEVQKNDFQFSVFVDEQETKMSVPTIHPVTPGNKLNVIAKEKENAQKFSHVEIEEIEQKPKTAPPRRSILPQLNKFSNGDPTKDNLLRRDLPPPFADDDVTCTTNVFTGGFLAASTPFTSENTRNKIPDFDYNSRELNGSIFASAPTEEMGPPISIPTLKDTRTDDNQLSTIYEVSSSSNRTGSSQSAGSATSTVSSGIVDEEGALVSTQPHLNMIDEEQEDIAGDFTQPYHHDVTICMNGAVDPFDQVLIHTLLKTHEFPQAHHEDGLRNLDKNVPVRRNDTYLLENEHFKIIKQLGQGSYAKVWLAVEKSTNRQVALKVQKPSWQWEYYVCREIQFRLTNIELASSFMLAERMYVYKNGSVLLTELIPYGSLLDLANKFNQLPSSENKEELVTIIASDLLRTVDALHACAIIHGDLKPDNILIRSIPKMGSLDSCLTIIDFGRSIDMSLFPPGTTFQRNVSTDGFSCVEMQTNRPWTYQTDLFGIASSIHCLLLGNYMKVRELNGRWQVQQSLPRWANKERWTHFFSSLINVQSCNMMPSLKTIREDLLKGSIFKSRHFEDLEKIIKS